MTTTEQPANAPANEPFIACWNEILTPKWLRFRHLLSGNGKIHSDAARAIYPVHRGERVLDLGCGFGETTIEMAADVGPEGRVLGVDCTEAFLAIARNEARAADVDNARFMLGDIQACDLGEEQYDLVYSRFGVMFCDSPVRALRNAHRSLRPGGRVLLIVWRRLSENPAWSEARAIALEHLPPLAPPAMTCGPGPFSMGDADTTRRMLEAARFTEVELTQNDAPICVGTTLEEAIDYQLLVGPAGELVREAGPAGERALPDIRRALEAHSEKHQEPNGRVMRPSSTWIVSARRA
jgi:SAM-dependent methyltransferase